MFIYVTTQREGVHCYPNAPNEVSFLRHPHRHLFYIKVWIEVFHDDREIEFFIFKSFIQRIVRDMSIDQHSCEQIATSIYKEIVKTYKNRQIKIDVSEDNENGVLLEWI